jgi:hypothetical protein
MIVLDSDHLSVLTNDQDKNHQQLVNKLNQVDTGFQLLWLRWKKPFEDYWR